MLKAAGVSKASVAGLQLEFHVEHVLRPVDNTPDIPKGGLLNNPEDKCKCGHSVAVEHGDEALCLLGCSPMLCHPPSDDSGR